MRTIRFIMFPYTRTEEQEVKLLRQLPCFNLLPLKMMWADENLHRLKND